MKPIRALLLASMLAVLNGCVVAPIDPGYYDGPQAYAVPPPVHYGAPAYYGSSMRFGIYGASLGHGHRR